MRSQNPGPLAGAAMTRARARRLCGPGRAYLVRGPLLASFGPRAARARTGKLTPQTGTQGPARQGSAGRRVPAPARRGTPARRPAAAPAGCAQVLLYLSAAGGRGARVDCQVRLSRNLGGLAAPAAVTRCRVVGRVVAAAERLWMFERGGWCCNVALRRRPSDFLGRSAATRRSESLRGRRRERSSSPTGTDRTGPALPEPPRPTRQLRVQQRLASESHHGGRARRCPAGRSEIRSGAHCGKDTSVEDAFRKQIPTRHSKRQQKVILLPGTEARICRNFDCRRVSQRLLNCLDKEWGARGSVRETCSPIKLH